MNPSIIAKDQNGNQYTIHVSVDVIDVSNFKDPNATVEGCRRYFLSDGTPVNLLRDGKFQIVGTEILLAWPSW